MKAQRIALKGFNTTPGGRFASELNGCASSFNFYTDGQMLTDGLTPHRPIIDGLERRITYPEGVTVDGIFYCDTTSGGRLFCYAEGSLYEADLTVQAPVFAVVEGVAMTACPTFDYVTVGGITYGLFGGSDGKGYAYDGTTFTEISVPEKLNTVLALGSSFAFVCEDVIYFSSAANPYEVDGVREYHIGQLSAKRAVLFNGEIIIAGECGLCRLTENPTEADEVKTILYGSHKIYPQTLCAGGDGVRFLTSGGVGLYDGYAPTISHADIGTFFTVAHCAFYADGMYHVSVDFADNVRKRGVISFLSDGITLSDLCVYSVYNNRSTGQVLARTSRPYVCTFGGNGGVEEAPIRTYATPQTDFGTPHRKVITELSAVAKKTFRLVINADGRRRMFVIKGGGVRRTIHPYVSGKAFSLTFIAEGNGVEISNVNLMVEGARA